jgi:hypothetical protein
MQTYETLLNFVTLEESIVDSFSSIFLNPGILPNL